MTVAGIDPGVTGAVVVISDTADKVRTYKYLKLPFVDVGKKRPELDVKAVMQFLDDNRVEHVCLEQVGYMGGAETSGFTAAILAGIYNRLYGALQALDFSLETVTPRKWQGVLVGKFDEDDQEKDIKKLKTKYGKTKLKNYRRKRIKAAVAEWAAREHKYLFKMVTDNETAKAREGVVDALALAHYGMFCDEADDEA